MKKNILIGVLLLAVALIGIHVHYQNKLSTADHIRIAVVDYLNKDIQADFLDSRSLEKLDIFKEKFEAENFDDYRVEAYQPDNESEVYLMLIVEPDEPEEQGIVLYMTFYLKKEYPIEIKQLIISNWVVIEYEAIQF